MKIFSQAAQDALKSGQVIVSGAVRFVAAEPFGYWGGHGAIAIDGFAFKGLGDRGLVSVSGGTLGGREQGAELRLSGVDPDVVGQFNLRSLRGMPVVIWRLIFNGSGAELLHAAVFLRGRVDRADLDETPGGTAAIVIGIEGAARGLGRRSERMRTDADQRLIAPNDGAFRRIAYAGEKTIHWGGKPPVRAGTAVAGNTYGGSSGPGGGRPDSLDGGVISRGV